MWPDELWDDDVDWDKDKYVVCPGCGSFNVVIETECLHVSSSDGIQKKNGVYVALNSEASWSTLPNTEKFVCRDCKTDWAVDKKVVWNWVY